MFQGHNILSSPVSLVLGLRNVVGFPQARGEYEGGIFPRTAPTISGRSQLAPEDPTGPESYVEHRIIGRSKV